jgi:glutamyl-tRNA synthetase
MRKVVTRFAPSPTGYLHIGGLRTALFSYLWAKKQHGTFLLRIEDTDQKREVEGATEKLIETLNIFGLHPDGDIVIQSEHANTGVYRKYAQQLVDEKKAYYCFCSEDRLAELRESQQAQKLPPRYDGHCRDLSSDIIQKNLADKTNHVIRLALPEKPKTIVGEDLVHGKLSFESSTLNDTVLLKSDGIPTYHLANVVDDHLMHITHVIRGEEWIPSFPLHVLLYEYFGFDLPQFCHLPLILNPDRSKLSKRQGDVAVEQYLAKGYLKEALLNYVVFLGWNPGDEREIFSLDDLIQAFELEKIHSAGAIFSIEKLNWYNSWYIKNILAPKTPKELQKVLTPFLPGINPDQQVAVFNLFFERITHLGELVALSHFLWILPHYEPQLLVFKKSTPETTQAGLTLSIDLLKTFKKEWTAINLELALKKATEDAHLKPGDVFWPLRVAVSGLPASPAPTEIVAFLGKDETLSRLHKALEKSKHLA